MIIGAVTIFVGFCVSFLAFAVGSMHPTPSQTSFSFWFFGGLSCVGFGAALFLVEFVRWLS